MRCAEDGEAPVSTDTRPSPSLSSSWVCVSERLGCGSMRVLGMSSWIHLRGALASILMLAAWGDSDGGASAQPLTGSTTHGETMASLGSESGATTTESTEASSVATTEATTPEI